MNVELVREIRTSINSHWLAAMDALTIDKDNMHREDAAQLLKQTVIDRQYNTLHQDITGKLAARIEEVRAEFAGKCSEQDFDEVLYDFFKQANLIDSMTK